MPPSRLSVCPLFQHLPCALTHPLSCIPFSQTAKHPQLLQLLQPCSTSGPFRLSLAEVPRGGEQVWGAWPQIQPGGSEPVWV